MNEKRIKEIIVKFGSSVDHKIRVYFDQSKFTKTNEIEITFEFLENITEEDDCRWFDNAGIWNRILREEIGTSVEVRLMDDSQSTSDDQKKNLTIIFESKT